MSEQTFQNADEICKIIAACRRAGVSQFRCGPLDVTFGSLYEQENRVPRSGVLARRQAASGAVTTQAAEDPEETIRAETAKIATTSFEEQELEAREQRIAELIIEDPFLAEQMMREGDLVEPDGESNGSAESDDEL